jgi:hypothetical protein
MNAFTSSTSVIPGTDLVNSSTSVIPGTDLVNSSTSVIPGTDLVEFINKRHSRAGGNPALIPELAPIIYGERLYRIDELPVYESCWRHVKGWIPACAGMTRFTKCGGLIPYPYGCARE